MWIYPYIYNSVYVCLKTYTYGTKQIKRHYGTRLNYFIQSLLSHMCYFFLFYQVTRGGNNVYPLKQFEKRKK